MLDSAATRARRHAPSSTRCDLRNIDAKAFQQNEKFSEREIFKIDDRARRAAAGRHTAPVGIIQRRLSARLVHMQDDTLKRRERAGRAAASDATTHASNDQAPAAAAQAPHEPFAAALDYTLTVGQAQQRFAELERHVPRDAHDPELLSAGRYRRTKNSHHVRQRVDHQRAITRRTSSCASRRCRAAQATHASPTHQRMRRSCPI